MKFFAVVVVLAVVAGAFAITQEQKEKAEATAKQCIQESGAKPENVQKLKEGDTTDNSPETKKFATCFFKASGFLNDQGEFDEQKTIDKLSASSTPEDKKKIEQLVKGCKAQSGSSNKEDLSLNLYRCYVKNKAL